MNKTYVEINNLTKFIKGREILSDINLNLDKGKIYGFMGKNGSGKTMLFRSICGLIKASKGEVIINEKILGRDISFPESVGVLIEYPGFLPNLTGFENLKYLADIKSEIGKAEIETVLENVGLDKNDSRKFKRYSLGMKQRLGIAQAIMENPELIILDEPTNALDTDGIALINNIIMDLKKQNKIILIASHDKEELELIADEIYKIDGGKILGHVVLKEKVSNEK
ncbi:ATP-binding cassette domain-containing protein [Clostridium saccharoperbutylacetonicum]|uniref:ATP-binding cassette domain-containing protein n=1 Tax=Clostridium saccharoperbutylacetonicum TaxID=36745 RepID=UPI0039EAC5D5